MLFTTLLGTWAKIRITDKLNEIASEKTKEKNGKVLESETFDHLVYVFSQ